MSNHLKAKLWKRTRGAISILLVCLLLPFLSLAALYVEAGRYQSGMRAMNQALNSGALSTLANMDSYLLKRFGLLAVKQKTDSVDAELTSSVNKYYAKQEIMDTQTVESVKITANGVYPLSDTSVLKQQILEASAAVAPTKFLVEFGNIDSLVKQIQKSLDFLCVLDTFKSCTGVLEKQVKAYEALDDARNEIKELKKTREKYDSAFTDWQSDVASLASHLATSRPDEEKHPILAAFWDNTKTNRTDAAENSRQAYLTQVNAMISGLDTLESKLNAAVQSKTDFEQQLGSTAFGVTKSEIDALLVGEDDEEVKAFGGKMKNILSSGENTIKAEYSRMSDLIDKFSPESLQNASIGLQQEKQRVEGYSTGSITGSTSQPDGGTYHFVALDAVTDPKAVDEYMDQSEEELDNLGILDVLRVIVEIVDSLFSVETIADGTLNTRLDTAYYQSAIGGLPSKNPTDYKNPYAAEDEQRSKDYLAMIDPDYDEDDPYGLVADSLEGKLQNVIDRLNDLCSSGSNLMNVKGIIEKLKALWNVIVDFFQFLGSIISFATALVKSIADGIYNKFLLSMYMAYNMPNRINYSSGTGMLGYKFATIPRPPENSGYNVPVFGDIASMIAGGETGYSFRGAEMEYLMWGSESELKNQYYQFALLMVVRLLINLVPTFGSDAFWSGIIQPLIPVYGAGIVIGVLVATAEGFVDASILASGGEVSLVKKHLFLSPEGVPDLIEQFTFVKLSDASKTKVIQKVAEATKTGYTYTPKPKVDLTKDQDKPIIDWDKYKSGLASFTYTEYSAILMMFILPESKSLARLADLIQCESTMRNQTTGASLSQQTSGEYSKFNINKAYTTLRISASGKLKPLLPVAAMTSGGRMSVNSVLYRGY